TSASCGGTSCPIALRRSSSNPPFRSRSPSSRKRRCRSSASARSPRRRRGGSCSPWAVVTSSRRRGWELFPAWRSFLLCWASTCSGTGFVTRLTHASRRSPLRFLGGVPITSGMRSSSIRDLRHLAIVALLVARQPIAAAAQSALSGVVTVLKGRVTATRSSVPEPFPLQLRDGIFADEWIATGENAFARILLGGKAILTMQERSSLQISEDLSTSTLLVTEGRIAVAVARELTRTGELIEIKTPTALASSRGAVVITGVTKGVTTFTVIRGLVDVARIDPLSNRPVGPRIMLRAQQEVTI